LNTIFCYKNAEFLYELNNNSRASGRDFVQGTTIAQVNEYVTLFGFSLLSVFQKETNSLSKPRCPAGLFSKVIS